MLDQYTTTEIRYWFDAADLDGNGALSTSEFFLWALSGVAATYGARDLKRLFSTYDVNKTGTLDPMEFEQMLSDAGFGHAAREIFRALDDNNSGTVSYRELFANPPRLASAVANASASAAAVLAGLAWPCQVKEKGSNSKTACSVIDKLRGSRITAMDAKGVCAQLREQIAASGATVAEVLSVFDIDAGNEMLIDDMEFFSALKTHFGFRGTIFVADQAFKLIDKERRGTLGFDELFEFLNGKRHLLDSRSKRVQRMPFTLPADATYTFMDVKWDAELLRVLIEATLAQHNVSTANLVRAWDRNGDRTLDRHEFISRVRSTFMDGSDDARAAWEVEVHQLTESLFITIAGAHDEDAVNGRVARHVDVVELEAWLNKPARSDRYCIERLPLKTDTEEADDITNAHLTKMPQPKRGGALSGKSSISTQAMAAIAAATAKAEARRRTEDLALHHARERRRREQRHRSPQLGPAWQPALGIALPAHPSEGPARARPKSSPSGQARTHSTSALGPSSQSHPSAHPSYRSIPRPASAATLTHVRPRSSATVGSSAGTKSLPPSPFSPSQRPASQRVRLRSAGALSSATAPAALVVGLRRPCSLQSTGSHGALDAVAEMPPPPPTIMEMTRWRWRDLTFSCRPSLAPSSFSASGPLMVMPRSSRVPERSSSAPGCTLQSH